MSFVSEFPHDEIESVLGDIITFFGYGEPVQVTGRFTNEFIEQFDTEMVHPVFECQEKNVKNAKQGDALSFNDITYKIVGIQPDGQGLTTLILEQSC